MKRKTIYIASFSLLIASCFLFIAKGFAQSTPQGLDLTVSPPVLELNAKPGDKISEKFRVRNNQTAPVDLTIQIKKLAASGFDGEPVPSDGDESDEFLQWVTLNPTSFTALPDEWQDVNFTIEIPDSAAYGYYYVFRIAPTKDVELSGSGSKIKGEILIVTLLNVRKEGAKAEGQLVEFKPNRFVSEYLPVEFTARVENKGNVHIKPRGNIFIRGARQKDIAILEINDGLASVLPGGKRAFTSSWTDGFIVREPVIEDGIPKLHENGMPVSKISINWNKLTHFRMGKYTASLLMVYDDGRRDATIEGVATFWLIPYTAIAVILTSLVVLFIILRFSLRWYIRREVKRSRGR